MCMPVWLLMGGTLTIGLLVVCWVSSTPWLSPSGGGCGWNGLGGGWWFVARCWVLREYGFLVWCDPFCMILLVGVVVVGVCW